MYDDLIKRLRATEPKDSEYGENAQEAANIIERFSRQSDAVKLATIEECAKAAEELFRSFGHVAFTFARRIRALAKPASGEKE